MGENQARKRAECASSRKQGTPRANSTGQGGLVPQQRPLPDRPRAQRGGLLLFDGGFAIMVKVPSAPSGKQELRATMRATSLWHQRRDRLHPILLQRHLDVHVLARTRTCNRRTVWRFLRSHVPQPTRMQQLNSNFITYIQIFELKAKRLVSGD